MEVREPEESKSLPSCRCGHRIPVHQGADNRGKCMGRVRLWIIPRDAVPVRYRRDSDVFLTEDEARALIEIGASKVKKAPSYEKQFKKGMNRGFFADDCRCTLRTTLELGRVDLYHP